MTDILMANLGRGVGFPEFSRNLDTVLLAGKRAVICLLEVDEADRPEEMDAVAARSRRTHELYGERILNPILVPKHLTVVRFKITHACDGLARYTPARKVNEVTIAGDGEDPDETVMSLHVPRMPPDAAGVVQRELATRRLQSRRALRDRARARQAHGDAVVYAIDSNTHGHWPDLMDNEQHLVEAAIDRIRGGAPKGHIIRAGSHVWGDLTIDGHNLIGRRDIRVVRKASR